MIVVLTIRGHPGYILKASDVLPIRTPFYDVFVTFKCLKHLIFCGTRCSKVPLPAPKLGNKQKETQEVASFKNIPYLPYKNGKMARALIVILSAG